MPGSGKGTMSKKILEKRSDYVHLSTGDVFRKHIKDQTPLGLEILDVMNSGELVNDELTIAVVEDFIFENRDKNIIFDGFPRNVYQAEWLVDELQNGLIDLLHIDVSTDIAAQRIVKRSSIENRPEDGDMNIISKRFKDYYDLTKPILEWFDVVAPEQLIKIDGDLDSKKCFKEIVKKLSL